MKKLVFGLLAVFALNAANAQKDPNAKKVLDAVSAKFKTLKAVSANYKLTVTNKAGKNAGTKTGQIFMKGSKYKIQDKALQIFCDGATVWKYDQPANEYTVSPVDNSGSSLTPQKLFTNFYDKDFNYKLNGTKSVGGKNLTEIELTPTDTRKAFKKVLVYIDPAQQMIVSAKIFEDANTYEYSMSGLKTNAALTDDMFVFNPAKYPGVEKIDQ